MKVIFTCVCFILISFTSASNTSNMTLVNNTDQPILEISREVAPPVCNNTYGYISNGRLKISSNVTEIGANTYKDCRNISFVYIPQSVKRIGKYAFYNTTVIGVYYGQSLEFIDDYAFAWCRQLLRFHPKTMNYTNTTFYATNIFGAWGWKYSHSPPYNEFV